MKVAVLDDYQDAFRQLDCSKKLKGHEVVVIQEAASDEADLVDRLRDVEAVILNMQRTAFTAGVLKALPKLRLISQTGRNTSHLDLGACAAQGVTVSTGGTGGGNAAAELTWGLILSSVRHIPQEVDALRNGRWQTTLGTGLAGKTLGVFGVGRIGTIVAGVGRAFGMRVMCWDLEGPLARASEAGLEAAPTREALFENADVLCIHVQLNPKTRGLIKGDDLARMKPSALLVNTSRAQILEEGALLAALRRGRPGFAAVDVYEKEPAAGGTNPLLALDNVVCTPHLGYVEKDTYESLFNAAIDQVLAFAAGQPINVVR